MTFLYYLGLFILVSPVLAFLGQMENVDRRFKTGYKNNEEPLGCLGWLGFIYFAFIIGYGMMKFASFSDPSVDAFGICSSTKSDEIVIKNIYIPSQVNLRNRPSVKNSEVMRVAKAGEYLKYIGKENEYWYRVYINDNRDDKDIGFVHSNYAEIYEDVIETEIGETNTLDIIFYVTVGLGGLLILGFFAIEPKKESSAQAANKTSRKKASRKKNTNDDRLTPEEQQIIDVLNKNKFYKYKLASQTYISLLDGLNFDLDRIINNIALSPAFEKIQQMRKMDRSNNRATINTIISMDVVNAITYIKPGFGTKFGRDEMGYACLMLSYVDENSQLKDWLKKGIVSKSTKNDISKLISSHQKLNFTGLDLLADLNYGKIDRYITFLNRCALVICKSDDILSTQEQTDLVKLRKFTSKYLSSETANYSPQTKNKSKDLEQDKNETLEEVLNELNSMIGLSSVKSEVNSFINFIKVQKERKKRGIKSNELSLHCVFVGSPGTGKTTVARLLSKIYKHIGLLSKGHLMETDRSGLVAGYVGQSEIKTEKVINESLGGTLFIDEAYALDPTESMNDFGDEVISLLLKKMEDHRDDLAIIAAGYPEEMKNFIASNPGLESRFNRIIQFEDYNEEELYAIFVSMCSSAQYLLDEPANEKVKSIIKRLVENKTDNFGNARVMRNLMESSIENQSNRVSQMKNLTSRQLMLLKTDDIDC